MDEMLAGIYGRAYAAAISANDPSVVPDVEARMAVKNFIKMMKGITDRAIDFEATDIRCGYTAKKLGHWTYISEEQI